MRPLDAILAISNKLRQLRTNKHLHSPLLFTFNYLEKPFIYIKLQRQDQIYFLK